MIKISQKSKYLLNKSKKAYAVYDFIFALITFIMIFIFILINFNNHINNLETKNELQKLNAESQDLCYLITNSQGFPNNWETLPFDTNYQIGLSNNYGIEKEKLDKFRNLDYSEIVKSFNIKNNLLIEILDINNNLITKKGESSGYDSVFVGKSSCYGFIGKENKTIKITMEVWK